MVENWGRGRMQAHALSKLPVGEEHPKSSSVCCRFFKFNYQDMGVCLTDIFSNM